MYIRDFVWLFDIIEKLLVKHSVTQLEVEEIFDNHPRIRFVQRGDRRGEDLYSVRGQTDTGRYLIIFFIYKSDSTALIISARDMSRSERRHYGTGR